MSSGTIKIDNRLSQYLDRITRPETATQRRLRAETGKMSEAQMQIGPNQGALMAFLVGLIGAKNAIEIGTFTGYSALAVAGALPPDGKLICCDVSEEWTSIARRAWEEAGLADRIELKHGPWPVANPGRADRKPAAAGTIDFAFIDADKQNYDRYYEQCLILVRQGGIIAVDNALWDGAVADPKNHSESTQAIRALNEKMRDDPRVDFCLIPVGDGIALARPRRVAKIRRDADAGPGRPEE